METKSFCCGSRSSDIRARGHAGRQITSDEVLMRMTWYDALSGSLGMACLRR